MTILHCHHKDLCIEYENDLIYHDGEIKLYSSRGRAGCKVRCNIENALNIISNIAFDGMFTIKQKLPQGSHMPGKPGHLCTICRHYVLV